MIFHILFYLFIFTTKVAQVTETLAASLATVFNEANKEMLEVARRSNPSVLRQRL